MGKPRKTLSEAQAIEELHSVCRWAKRMGFVAIEARLSAVIEALKARTA